VIPYLAVFPFLLGLRLAGGTTLPGKRLALMLASVVLGLWVGYRYRVGCDWSNYIRYGRDVTETLSESLTRRDPLFNAAVWMIDVVGFEFYPAINVLTALVVFVGIGILARHVSDKVGFLYYLYPVLIIGLAMSGIRQAIAIGFVMIALDALLRHRSMQFVALIAIAAGFHFSAIFFMLAWPFTLRIKKHDQIILMLLFAVPISVGLLRTEAAALAQTRYLNSDIAAQGAIFRLALLSIGSVVFFVLARKRWKERRSQTYFLIYLGALTSIALLALVNFNSVIADRLGYYMIPIIAMFLADVPSLFSGNMRKLLNLGLFSMHFLFFVAWISLSRLFQACYLPYQMIIGQ